MCPWRRSESLLAARWIFCFSSYLVLVPKLLRVGHDNQLSVFITPSTSRTVEVRFDLHVAEHHIQSQVLVQPGDTRNGTLLVPRDFPLGAGQLTVCGEGGVQFEEKHQVLIYDNRHVLLVQSSASTYRPGDQMKVRVVATDEHLMPMESNELIVEIYDAALKLVGRFDRLPVRSGLTETIEFPLSPEVNAGSWLVSATLGNTTSSLEVLVSRPITPSFDLKAIFERFLLRNAKVFRGSIEMHSDQDHPILGRALIAIGPVIDPSKSNEQSWKQWKQQHLEIAGRVEFNFDLLSQFEIDVSQVLAIEIYIRALDLSSGEERVVRQLLPIFSREVIYDIHPLQFEAAMSNEFEVIARRPDGKPTKMEDLIVTLTMYLGPAVEEKSLEIKDFFTRGRNDLSFFKVDLPENCLGLLMTITPLDTDGQRRDYQTQAVPLMPRAPRRNAAKLSIELLPSTTGPLHTDVKVPVVSSQISALGRTSNFYIQVIPSQPIEKVEPLPMSFLLLSNGRLTLVGQFQLEPSNECQTKSTRAIRPEEPRAPSCLFNGTLPIRMTREMLPYSTLIVYSFDSTFGYILTEAYRFAVAGLFQSSLTINATVVPYSPEEVKIETEDSNVGGRTISPRTQERTRVELAFTGPPNSLLGVNVFEYDAVLQGLNNELTKERLIKHLIMYEDVPIDGMPVQSSKETEEKQVQKRGMSSLEEEEQQRQREQLSGEIRYPLEKLIFGIAPTESLPSVEGDDVYLPSSMNEFYPDASQPASSSSHFRNKLEKARGQFDSTIEENDSIVVPGIPLTFEKPAGARSPPSSGTSVWYEKVHSQLKKISPEAMIFMNSALTVISDIPSLSIPSEMTEVNLTRLISEVHCSSFTLRDTARQLFEEYLVQSDRSLLPPPIVLDEISRTSYAPSIFFNSSRLDSHGNGRVLLPRTKPFASWMATAFALNAQSGLAFGQPVRLPRTAGLFVIGNAPGHVRLGEHVLLAYAIHNYLGRDVNNVLLRIRSSPDFDLLDQSEREEYNLTIPMIRDGAVLTRDLLLVPKRAGVLRVIIEVESEFGGDYESVLLFPRETGIEQELSTFRLFDLTKENSVGPVIEQIPPSAGLRSVKFSVSGNSFDRLLQRCSTSFESFVGIDHALMRLYRALTLRQYLNETSQIGSELDKNSTQIIGKAYQELQMYNGYDGSYSWVADEMTGCPSLYLTSLAFGALVSPLMPFHDAVTLNRTLNWILSHQQADGSFDDRQGQCFHPQFCGDEFRRESLTALVLYSLTHDNVSDSMPEYLRRREVTFRAQQFLISRVPEMKPHLFLITLVEMAFIQNRTLTSELRTKIYQTLLTRPLEVNSTDQSKHLKISNDTPMSVDDQFVLNAMTTSIYASYNQLQMAIDLARWLTNEMNIRPRDDNLLNAIFRIKAWWNVDALFRRQFSEKKVDVTVEVTADHGEKKVIKIDQTNWDRTQTMNFTLPVKEISYTVRGFGLVNVEIRRSLVEQEWTSTGPFQLTQEFHPLPSINEVEAKTCLTYNPTNSTGRNQTIAVHVQLPSGTRANLRQIDFLLSGVEQLIVSRYEPHSNKLIFVLTIPSLMFNKEICFPWALNRLSSVNHWSPIVVHAYDYLRQNLQFFRVIPVQFQPDFLGQQFLEAVQKAQPTVKQV